MGIKKLTISTDAWAPQINGVATTYQSMIPVLEDMGIKIQVIHPNMFKTVPTVYPDVKMALATRKRIHKMLNEFQPDAIHIGVEGSIGIQTKLYLDKHGIGYSTAFHTKYAEYAKKHLKIPLRFGWKVLRWFHNNSKSIMVPTQSMMDTLVEKGFDNLNIWTRGVRTDIFYPREKEKMNRPVFAYVGRVSPEKTIEEFLKIPLEGTKMVVGDGPSLNSLKKEFPDAVYTGMLHGNELAQAYSNADVFVFPSKTDTFGVVILEALACGVPVAAYPVTGPVDILTNDKIGFMNDNLEIAIKQALEYGDADECIKFARERSWNTVANQFLQNLIPIS